MTVSYTTLGASSNKGLLSPPLSLQLPGAAPMFAQDFRLLTITK